MKSVLFKKYLCFGILLQNLSRHIKQKSLLYLRIKWRNTIRLPLKQIHLCKTGTHLQNKTTKKKWLSNWIQIWLLQLLKTAEHNGKISFLMRLPPVMICKTSWLLIVLAMVTESLTDIATLHECTTDPHGGMWIVTVSDPLSDPRSRKWRFTRPPAHGSFYLALQRCWWRRIALAELELVSFGPRCTYCTMCNRTVLQIFRSCRGSKRSNLSWWRCDWFVSFKWKKATPRGTDYCAMSRKFQNDCFSHTCLMKVQLVLCYGNPVTVIGNYAYANSFSVSEPPFIQISNGFTVFSFKVWVGDRFSISKTKSPNNINSQKDATIIILFIISISSICFGR